MKFLGLTVIFSCFLLTVLQAANIRPPEYPAGNSNQVFYLPQFSEFEAISDRDMLFLKKTLQRAADAKAKAVILELDTPGGAVNTAVKYLSVMERSAVPIIVYLNPQGISAGMIIALGADRVAISPNGMIGDAMPMEMGMDGSRPVVDKPGKAEKTPPPPAAVEKPARPGKNTPAPGALEQILEELHKSRKTPAEDKEQRQLADQKFLTFFFKMLQVLAEKNDRPVRVVRAMADPYVKLDEKTDGIKHDKVSPLTLSATEAAKLGVVDYIVNDRADLLKQLNLSDAKILEIRRTPTEQIGAFLGTPAIAGLLLIIGLVGLFVEVKTPGFGVPGVLGVCALTLFFLGHIASGASDWGPMVVFFVGLILLALELFLIPGFGLVGVLGIGCILISFFWAFGFGNVETAVRVITASLAIAISAMVLLATYVLPKTPLFRRVTLNAETSREAGFVAASASPELLGKYGVSVTPLRPTGVVVIDGNRHDACTEGDFIDDGTPVTVTACHGFQVVVRRS